MSESQARQRADRIREVISITVLLEDLGYGVRSSGGWREQQFSCNLHGDGSDSKPSARVYPESESWYCFACDLTRDAIGTVQAVEGLEFWPAVKLLEKKYNLPYLKWDGPVHVNLVDEVTAGLRQDRTFEDDVSRVHGRLDRFTQEWKNIEGEQERSLALLQATSFWEAFDKVLFQVRGPKGKGGPWTEVQGRAVLLNLQKRMLKISAQFG